MADLTNLIAQAAIIVPPILLAVILHEVAHGYVAWRLGDDTAARRGRLTLNPIPHIDPFGTIALPLLLTAVGSPFLFGWAKPVPVNFAALRNPKRDMVAVAFAGPATNLALAALSAGAAHLLVGAVPTTPWYLDGGPAALLAKMAVASVQINVALAVFNLVPILPLDGGRVLAGLLPRPQAIAFARLEPYGLFIVMALLFTGMLSAVLGPVANFMIRTLL